MMLSSLTKAILLDVSRSVALRMQMLSQLLDYSHEGISFNSFLAVSQLLLESPVCLVYLEKLLAAFNLVHFILIYSIISEVLNSIRLILASAYGTCRRNGFKLLQHDGKVSLMPSKQQYPGCR